MPFTYVTWLMYGSFICVCTWPMCVCVCVQMSMFSTTRRARIRHVNEWMCLSTYKYARTFAHECDCVWVHRRTQEHVHVNVNVFEYKGVCKDMCMCVQFCVYACVCACWPIYLYLCMNNVRACVPYLCARMCSILQKFRRLCACVCVCVCVCVYVCVCVCGGEGVLGREKFFVWHTAEISASVWSASSKRRRIIELVCLLCCSAMMRGSLSVCECVCERVCM